MNKGMIPFENNVDDLGFTETSEGLVSVTAFSGQRGWPEDVYQHEWQRIKICTLNCRIFKYHWNRVEGGNVSPSTQPGAAENGNCGRLKTKGSSIWHLTQDGASAKICFLYSNNMRKFDWPQTLNQNRIEIQNRKLILVNCLHLFSFLMSRSVFTHTFMHWWLQSTTHSSERLHKSSNVHCAASGTI